MLDPLNIVQAAAIRIGEEPPGALDDIIGDDSVELLYNMVVDFCLDLHTWDFARELRQLSRRADAASPILGFDYVYDLPADAIGEPLRVIDRLDDDRPFFGWTMGANSIFSSAEPLYAFCAVRPLPARWSAAFREAAILAIAAELALSLASNDDLRRELRTNAYGTPSQDFRGGAIGVAIRNQAFRTPAKRLDIGHNPLTAAWQR